MKNEIASYQVGQKIALVKTVHYSQYVGSYPGVFITTYEIVKISKRPRMITLRSEDGSVIECKYVLDTIESPARFSHFDDISPELLARAEASRLLSVKVQLAVRIQSAMTNIRNLDRVPLEDLAALLKTLEDQKESD